MLSFKGKLKDIGKTLNNRFVLTIVVDTENLSTEELNTLKSTEKGIKVDMSVWREKRSLDANSYCWVLIDKIATEVSSTKEEVYRKIIKKVGVFEILPIKETCKDRFIRNWESKGLGWVCESLGKSKLPNYENVVAYYGTSVYDSKEMSRFIEEVVFEAKDLGIQTLTPEELKQIENQWGK